MKYVWTGILLALLWSGPAASEPALTTDEQRTVYALGVQLMLDLSAFNLTEQELLIVQRAMRDMRKGELAIDPNQYLERVGDLAQSRQQAQGRLEAKRGQAYLEAAKRDVGAQLSPSGLVLKVERAGKGVKPTSGSKVRVHYRGALVDGTVFDSSYERGQPVEFALNQVIPCWTDALTQLRIGAKAKLVCPPRIAYGRKGAPPAVPPNATLVFDVELLQLVK